MPSFKRDKYVKSRKHRRDRGPQKRATRKEILTIRDIAKRIHKNVGVDFHGTRRILNAAVMEMAEAVVKGMVVQLRGFGSIQNRYRAPIKWKKSTTLYPGRGKKAVTIGESKASYIVSFKASAWLKAANFRSLHGELPPYFVAYQKYLSSPQASEVLRNLSEKKRMRVAMSENYLDDDMAATFIEKLLLASPEPIQRCRLERKRLAEMYGPSKQASQGPAQESSIHIPNPPQSMGGSVSSQDQTAGTSGTFASVDATPGG